jgi:hypothetical protein
MPRFTTMLLSGFALLTVMSIASTANAQMPQSVVDQLTPKYRRQGPCRDPWLTIAIGDVFASTHTIQGIGDAGECNPHLYNGGSWGSYAELYRGVKTAFDNMRGTVTITKTLMSDRTYKIVMDAGPGYKPWTQVISNDGGTLISQDGSNIILNGGGNMRVQSTGTEKRINLGKSVLVFRKN